jgi:hypothetical protein
VIRYRSALPSALLTFALAGAGCDESPTEPRRNLAFQTIGFFPYSAIDNRGGEVIRDADRWSAAWAEIHSGTVPQPALPPVNFDAEMVILAAAGERPDSCWDVEIRSVEAGGGRIDVSVNEIHRTGCACLPAIVAPVHVVRAARADGAGRLSFALREIAVCP